MPSRVCRECDREKPLTREHFYIEAKRSDGTDIYRGQCIPCYLTLQRERKDARIDELRERWRWDARMRRQRDPERNREAVRRYRERKRQDPEFIERRRAQARERYRRRTGGGEVPETIPKRRVRSDSRPDSSQFPRLPAGPLARMLTGMIADDLSGQELALGLGIDESRRRIWLKPGANADFDTADQVLCRLRLHWWDVWTPLNTSPEGLARVEFAFTGEGPLVQGSQLSLEDAAA